MDSTRDLTKPEYLTAKDISTALQVSPGTARTMMRTGKLPGVRLNGRGPWRVKASTFHRLMEPEK